MGVSSLVNIGVHNAPTARAIPDDAIYHIDAFAGTLSALYLFIASKTLFLRFCLSFLAKVGFMLTLARFSHSSSLFIIQLTSAFTPILKDFALNPSKIVIKKRKNAFTLDFLKEIEYNYSVSIARPAWSRRLYHV